MQNLTFQQSVQYKMIEARLNLEIETVDPLICTMGYYRFFVSNKMEGSSKTVLV